MPLAPSSPRPASEVLSWIVYMLVLSLSGLVLPGWLVIRALRRRPWSWRTLGAIAIALAIAFGVYKLFTTAPLLVVFLPNDWRQWSPPVLLLALGGMAVSGIPGLAFIFLLMTWTMQGRWRKVAYLLAAFVLGVTPPYAVHLWKMYVRPEADVHYTMQGWWVPVLVGVQVAGTLVLLVLFLALCWRLFRQKKLRQPHPA